MFQCPQCDTPLVDSEEVNHLDCPQCGLYINLRDKQEEESFDDIYPVILTRSD